MISKNRLQSAHGREKVVLRSKCQKTGERSSERVYGDLARPLGLDRTPGAFFWPDGQVSTIFYLI